MQLNLYWKCCNVLNNVPPSIDNRLNDGKLAGQQFIHQTNYYETGCKTAMTDLRISERDLSSQLAQQQEEKLPICGYL
jgi:hypothetical protein